MELAYVEGPEVPVYKRGCLHIISYFLQGGPETQKFQM